MGLFKSQPTPPPAPDPNVVSAAQTKSNIATALNQSQLNNGNSSSPWGSVTNTYNPSSNQWSQNTTLSPAEQSIFNQGTQAQGSALGLANTQLGRVGGALGQNVNAPNMQTGVGAGQLATGFNPGQQVQGQVGPQNFGDAVNQTIQANYGAGYNLLAPQLAQQSEQNQANLIAQGLNPNDAAYQNQTQLMNNGQSQELAQLAAQSVNSGNAEQNTLFGQQLGQGAFANSAAAQQYAQNQGQASFQNTAQGQQFAQGQQNAGLYNSANQADFQNQAYAQQLPINEFDALMSSGQVQAPQAAQLGQTAVAPTDVLGAYGLQQSALQNTYDAQMKNYQSGMGGLFSLGSAAISAFG